MTIAKSCRKPCHDFISVTIRSSAMSVSNTTLRSMLAGAAAAAAFLGLTAAATSAEMPMDDVYDWSASLISVDQATGTAVFQARIEAYAHIGGLDSYKDGDRLTLVRLEAAGESRQVATDLVGKRFR